MEEVKQQETLENDNAQSVLDSFSDEYLRKKKRTRQIVYSSLLSVLLILVTMIIIFSSITVNLKPKFIDNPTSYIIKVEGKNEIYVDETDENYSEFIKVYNDSFKVTYLTALFTGKLGDYKIEETLDRFYTNDTNSTIAFDGLGNNYVRLNFASEQNIMNADGSVYHSIYDTANYELTFEDVYFNISSENEDSELTFYFATTGNGAGFYTQTKITIRANTYALYEFAKASK